MENIFPNHVSKIILLNNAFVIYRTLHQALTISNLATFIYFLLVSGEHKNPTHQRKWEKRYSSSDIHLRAF